MRKVKDGSSNEKTELSAARNEAVQRMHAGVEAMVKGGKSPRARGLEKAAEGLSWIYEWGWTTSAILGHVTGTARGTALAARLEQNGWIRRVPIRIVSHFRIAPTDVLTITHEGVAELTALLGELPRTTRTPWIGRVPKTNIIHDLLTQQLTLEYMGRVVGASLDQAIIQEHGLVTSYYTPLHPDLDTAEGKRPDAIWMMEDGCQLAIEVELSPKWDRELDQFVMRHLELQRRENNPVWALATFFTSEQTAERYRAAMRLGAQVKPWLWDKTDRKWSPATITSRDIIDDQFVVYTVVLPSPRKSTQKVTRECTDGADKTPPGEWAEMS